MESSLMTGERFVLKRHWKSQFLLVGRAKRVLNAFKGKPAQLVLKSKDALGTPHQEELRLPMPFPAKCACLTACLSAKRPNAAHWFKNTLLLGISLESGE